MTSHNHTDTHRLGGRFAKGLTGLFAAILSIICFVSCSSPAFAGEPNEIRLAFESSKVLDAILVRVKVNGETAVLIFDTGSNCTILSPEIVHGSDPKPQFQVSFPQNQIRESAAWTTVTLQIDAKVWKQRRVVVQKLDRVSTIFKQKIDGILGKDLLNEYQRVTIDLRERVIVLTSQEVSTESRESRRAESGTATRTGTVAGGSR
jgi:hypothetical protein